MIGTRMHARCVTIFILFLLVAGAAVAADTQADAVLKKLRSLGPLARAKTVQAMAAVRNPTLIRPLVLLLAEADAPYATLTKIDGVPYIDVLTNALRRYGDAAVDPLVDTLRTVKWGSQRALLINALANTGSQRAIRPMMDMIRRAPAGEARGYEAELQGKGLRRFGDAGLKALATLLLELAADREACISLCRALLAAGPRAMGYLTPLLRDPKAGSYARWALQEIGPVVAPLAISLLKDPDAGLRTWAMRALIEWADARALPYVIAMLSDDDPALRMEATYKLGTDHVLWGAPTLPDSAVEPLLTMLEDKDPLVSQAAFGVLEGLRDPRVIAALRLLIRGPNATLAVQAAIALVRLQDPETIKLLLALADVADHPLRHAVVLALAYANDPRGIQVLLEKLADPDPNVRISAIRTLAETRCPEAVVPLVTAALKDQSWMVRAAASRALGSFQDGRAVDALISALKDADRNVRTAAAEGLGLTNDPRALSVLLNAVSGIEGRDIALYGLAQSTSPQAVTKLLEFATSHDSTLRHIAFQGLGNSGSAKAVPALIKALKDPEERYFGLHKIAPLRMEAASSLGKLKNRSAIPALIAMLNDPFPYVARCAAFALTDITGQQFGYDAAKWKAWWAGQQK